MFHSAKPPPVRPTPPPPDRSNDEIQQAAEAQRAKFYGNTNSAASTMLTGGLGVPGKQSSATVRLFGQNVS
jgi:hypothetical protein